MNKPPDKLDGAKVIEYMTSQQPFGEMLYTDGSKCCDIYGFAICNYDNNDEYYIFSCNENWEVQSDTDFSSIESAKSTLKLSKQ
jgi:hypothetical protein